MAALVSPASQVCLFNSGSLLGPPWVLLPALQPGNLLEAVSGTFAELILHYLVSSVLKAVVLYHWSVFPSLAVSGRRAILVPVTSSWLKAEG